MKKILLVTLFDNGNIGNRLQNYALYTLLTSRNCYVVTLKDRTEFYPDTKMKIKNQIKHILGMCGNSKYKEEYQRFQFYTKIRSPLRRFSEQYIPHVIDASNGTDNLDFSSFDIGIVGSDQVWHHDNLPYFYLEFLPDYKRNAYAASFGFDEFPQEDSEDHKYGLNHMNNISCREQSGCDLIKRLIGKEAVHVLDPTLLLSTEKWRDLEKNADECVRLLHNYTLTYFLGSVTDEYKEVIREKAQGNKIINLCDGSNKFIRNCGPIEFLYLIDHCNYFMTDSFHGTVFATLFNKEFTVFRRKQEGFEKMFSRINELLISTGQEDRAYGGVDTVEEIEPFNVLKKRSLDYLDYILK